MKHLLISFIAVLVTASSVTAQEAKTCTLRWHGQSFFELETSKGTRIVFDPHAIEEYGRITVKADLILISHLHNDHTRTDVVENQAKAKILLGVKPGGKKQDWNPIDEKFQDVRVRTVGVYHDKSEGMERGKTAIFIVEADGMRFVHLGDLGHTLNSAQVKEIGDVDVLMIPVGGVYTINGSDAKEVVEQIKPRKYVIPMHCGTKVYDKLLTAAEFLEDQKNVKRIPGNRLEVSSDFKPSEAVIVELNWK